MSKMSEHAIEQRNKEAEMDLKIGEEVVVYARGRIRAMEEETIWNGKSYVKVVKYTIDYPDNAGFARVTEAVIERAETDARNNSEGE